MYILHIRIVQLALEFKLQRGDQWVTYSRLNLYTFFSIFTQLGFRFSVWIRQICVMIFHELTHISILYIKFVPSIFYTFVSISVLAHTFFGSQGGNSVLFQNQIVCLLKILLNPNASSQNNETFYFITQIHIYIWPNLIYDSFYVCLRI